MDKSITVPQTTYVVEELTYRPVHVPGFKDEFIPILLKSDKGDWLINDIFSPNEFYDLSGYEERFHQHLIEFEEVHHEGVTYGNYQFSSPYKKRQYENYVNFIIFLSVMTKFEFCSLDWKTVKQILKEHNEIVAALLRQNRNGEAHHELQRN